MYKFDNETMLQAIIIQSVNFLIILLIHATYGNEYLTIQISE